MTGPSQRRRRPRQNSRGESATASVSPTLRINWPFLMPAAAAGDPSSTSTTTTPAVVGIEEVGAERAIADGAGVVDPQAAPGLGPIGGDDLAVDGNLARTIVRSIVSSPRRILSRTVSPAE